MDFSLLENYEFIPTLKDSNKKILTRIADKCFASFEQIMEIFEEYKAFMILLANHSAEERLKLLPSLKVMHFWREHVLFSESYANFCDFLCKDLLFYNVKEYMNVFYFEKNLELYENTKNLLLEKRGKLNEAIWPKTEEMINEFKLLFRGSLGNIEKAITSTTPAEKNFRESVEKSVRSLNLAQVVRKVTFNEVKTQTLFESIRLPKGLYFLLKNELLFNETATENLINEYKKLLVMFAVADFPVAPSALVDEAWHWHLMYFVNYSQNCKNLKNVPFINHVPTIEERTKSEEKSSVQLSENSDSKQERELNDYEKTIELYKTLFGEVNTDFWLLPKSASRDIALGKYYWFRLDMVDSTAQKRVVQGSDCSTCNGGCNTVVHTKLEAQTNDCSGCNGSCTGPKELTSKLGRDNKIEDCNGCNGSCNSGKFMEKLFSHEKSTLQDCNGCNGSCNSGVKLFGKIEKEEDCNGCNGSCNNKGLNLFSILPKSDIKDCNGCNGSCNSAATLFDKLKAGQSGKLQDCNGCNGSCNSGVKTLLDTLNNHNSKSIESCNGCNGSCNNSTLFATIPAVKLNQAATKTLNTSISTIEDCNGCNGSCNHTELITKLTEKFKELGGKLSDCSGCNGSCTGAKALEKVVEKCREAEGKIHQVSDCTIPCMAKIE